MADAVVIPISECDLELFHDLVFNNESFSWNFDGVEIIFVQEKEDK